MVSSQHGQSFTRLEGVAMLLVDLDVPDFQIEQSIKNNCAKLGTVRLVRIHRTPAPFALIHMATDKQTHELSSRFGGSTFGTCALVHLEQMRNRTSGGIRTTEGLGSKHDLLKSGSITLLASVAV